MIDENGVFSKLRILGMDDKEEISEQEPLARLDAEFVLLTGILRQMIADLKKLLGGFE